MRSLAEQMTPKITAQAISKYEAGKMLPSSTVLIALGKALNVSLDFLMSAQVEAFDGLDFRKHSGASARDRAKADALRDDWHLGMGPIPSLCELSKGKGIKSNRRRPPGAHKRSRMPRPA